MLKATEKVKRSTEGLKLHIETESAAIESDAWDALVGDRPLCTYGWLRSIEESQRTRLEPRYFLVRERDQLRAAAICYRSATGPAAESLNSFFLPGASRLLGRVGIAFLPALTCGAPEAIGEHLFLSPELEPHERERVLDFLLDGIEARATSEQLAVAFQDLDASEQALLSRLHQRRYVRAAGGAHGTLRVEWSSFEEYLQHLRRRSRNVPKNIRRMIRRSRAAGVELRPIADASRYAGELHAIADAHHRRVAQRPFPFEPCLFERLQARLGDDVSITGAFRKGELVGFAVDVRSGKAISAKFIGVDQGRAGNSGAYFQLGYNQTIQRAIDSGITRIDFGRSLQSLKSRRGCAMVPTWTAYRARTAPGRLASWIWVKLLARLRDGRLTAAQPKL